MRVAVQAYEARYASYLLADELRQSSDDLTRLARTYAVTGDTKWKEQYEEVLDIRAGKRPRPADYHKIYWDFRAAEVDPARGYGPAIPLTELMKRAGFTELEFEKLNQAERNSNDLVRTETIAMNMVAAGNVADAQDGANARNLMHGADYHQFKARIMQPLDEFFTALEARTQASIDVAEQHKRFWYATLVILAVALMGLLFGSLWIAYRQLARSLSMAVNVSDAIASGNLHSEIKVQGPHEIAALLRAMGRMRTQLVGVVSNVRQNAETVAMACDQIAQGNNHLSSRTQEQAGALEETAASMEQLSATVHRNADNATQASQLSSGASAIAERGG
jgi:methyl-accepting chemotaxis protein